MVAKRQPSMMEPPIESLLQRVDSKFSLVSLSAKRAREINTYFNELSGGQGPVVPPQVTSVSRKSLSIALEEINEDKIVPVRRVAAEESETGDEAGAAE